MEYGAKRFPLAIAAVVLAALLIPPHVAQAQTRNVHCPGGSIGLALRLPSILPLTVVVQGTCNENLVIQRDDVTIQAGAGGASIVSASPSATTKDVVTIDGAKRIVLSGLTISGGATGVVAKNGGQVSVLGSTIQNNTQNGIRAIFGSTVTVDSAGATQTTLSNNGSGGNPPLGQHGVAVADNSTGVILNASISGNAGHGIAAFRSSSVWVGVTPSAVFGPVTVSGNGGHGILVYTSSQGQIQGNTIQNNALSGISVDLASSAGILQNLVQSNGGTGITVTNASGARIGISNAIVPSAPRRADGNTNTIRSNGNDGIAISQGANANLYGNLVELNSGRGVSIGRAAGESLGDNKIQDNVLDGLAVFSGQFLQTSTPALSPFRDYITGNGTGGDPNRAWGVTSFDHSGVRLESVEISGNHNDGVLVSDSSTFDIRSIDGSHLSLITNNGTQPSNFGPPYGNKSPFNIIFGNGININNGSSADVRGVLITNNKSNGISVTDHSFVAVRSNTTPVGSTTPTVVLSTISGNTLNGVNCRNGASVNVSRNSTISGNGTTGTGPGLPTGSGINTFLGCSVVVTDSTITGNAATGITVSTNSAAQVFSSSPDNPPNDGFYTGFTLGSAVTNNGTDGISVTTNSALNVGTAGPQPTLTAGPANNITGNHRFGVVCNAQSIASVNFSAVNISGNTGGTIPPDGVTLHQTSPDPLNFNCS